MYDTIKHIRSSHISINKNKSKRTTTGGRHCSWVFHQNHFHEWDIYQKSEDNWAWNLFLEFLVDAPFFACAHQNNAHIKSRVTLIIENVDWFTTLFKVTVIKILRFFFHAVNSLVAGVYTILSLYSIQGQLIIIWTEEEVYCWEAHQEQKAKLFLSWCMQIDVF